MTARRTVLDVSFNSRPHEEVDLSTDSSCPDSRPFNSRPHEEVDVCFVHRCKFYDLSIHDLTRRSTTDLRGGEDDARSFQFTTSRGGRPFLLSIFHFHSSLSIHDLTRRSTWSSQSILIGIPIFQFTTSRGGRPVLQAE